MSDPFPVKKREELLRQRIEQMRRNDEWHLFQDFCHVRPTQCRPPPSFAASALTNARATKSVLGGRRRRAPDPPAPAMGVDGVRT